MADRPKGSESGAPEEGTPDYDWLYGTRSKGRGSSPQDQPGPSQGRVPSDPEPTRMMPTLNRPSNRPSASDPVTQPRGERPPGPRRIVSANPPTRPPSKPRKRRGLRWVKLLVLLWVVFLIAVPAWAWTNIDKVAFEPSGPRPDDQPGTTYLLVGSDSREGLTAKERRRLGTGKASGKRTDTIMMLHTGSGPNLLMSIPRDSIVPVPGYGDTKINAAYAYGGPKLLVRTLENTTGIRIDDYVEIGFAGFVDVVDAVGGIKICPKTAMKDPLANLDIKKGCRDADGPTALGYARSRHTSALGDIDRARRQREVVSAVGSEAASPWSITNPVRYFRLASAGSNSLSVGKGTGPIATMKFAWAMTRLDGKNGLTCGVPIADLAVHWDRERALKLFGLIKADRTEDVSKDLCGASGLKNP